MEQELDDLISDWTRTVESGLLLDLMEKHGVPAGRIYRAPEMMEDPHFKARQNIIKVAHPIFGKLAMQNVAPRLSDTPGGVVHPGPELGEHTVEVLGGILGLGEDRLADLKAAGII